MTANKSFHVNVLLLVYFCDYLWHRKFVTADVTAVIVGNQHGIQRRGEDFDKSLYLKWYTADEFPEKSRTKRGVSKLLKLRDTGTVDRRPGSGRPRSEKKIQCLRMLTISNILLIHKYT